MKCGDCKHQGLIPVDEVMMRQHLQGRAMNDSELASFNLNYAVLSGTKSGYSVRCTWSEICLFEPQG